MKRTLGLVTIGQSPRTDLTSDIADQLAAVNYIEHGALDGMTDSELDRLRPAPEETPLTSRLAGGTNIVMSHKYVQPLLTQAVQRCVDDGAEAVLILCTGHMSPMDAAIPVYYAEDLAHNAVAEQIGKSRLGNISPMPDQVDDALRRWRKTLPGDVLGDHANPYLGTIQDIETAAVRLAERGADQLFLDCIGYTSRMREAASRRTGLNTLLARSLAVSSAVKALDGVSPR